LSYETTTEEEDVNVVILIGNLATDVDVREFAEGRKRATFRLAVDRQSSAGGADFFDVKAWDKQAEVCERFLDKGKRIGLDGRLSTRTWEDAEGKRRYGVEVVAHSFEFLWPREGGEPVDSPFAEVVQLAERSMA
jgi:single-strand DNA-binding protein